MRRPEKHFSSSGGNFNRRRESNEGFSLEQHILTEADLDGFFVLVYSFKTRKNFLLVGFLESISD